MYHHELFHLDRSIGLFSVDEIARNLKYNGMWVNAVDDRGDTPLHIAARNNAISFVSKMLPHYDRVNAVNEQGDSLLHLFVDNCMRGESDFARKKPIGIRRLVTRSSEFFNEKHRIIRRLIAKGADVNLRNKQGVTPAQLAAKHGHVDVLRIIFASGDKQQRSRVRLCEGSAENLLHLIYKNAKSRHKDSPMEMRVTGCLIDRGCDVNAVDADGYSAMHYALQTRGPRTAKKLVQLGFDVRRWDKKVLSRILLTAAAACNPSLMRFLIEQGADVNVKHATGRTPLHFASSRSLQQYEAMEVLLKSGAHVDARDNAGRLPLDYALSCKNVEALECLMEFGVDVVHTSSFRRLSFSRIMDRWLLEKFLLRHLSKLSALGLRIDRVYEPYLNETDWQIYRRICLEEVKESKLLMVADDTSLYDFLHMKTKRCRYAHLLPKLLRVLKSSFPIYYGIIRIRIHEIEKRSLIEPATAAWYELTNIRLPYVCVENIMSHLNSCCLRVMIDSSDDRIVYNSVLLRAKWLEEA